MRKISYVSLIFCFTAAIYADLPILQGPTSEAKTEILVLHERDQKIAYSVQGPTSTSVSVHSKGLTGSAWVVDSVFVELQNPSASPGEFQLAALNGTTKNVLASRSFGFLTPNTQLNFAVVSCASDGWTGNLPSSAWQNLERHNPQFILWLGDNVYAALFDPITPDRYWERFVQTRQRLNVFYWPKLVPSFATWDDHDFGGGNNGNGSYAYKNATLEIFKAFFGGQSVGPNHEFGPGNSSSFIIGNQQFVLLDSRYFKGPEGNIASRALWGPLQLNWLGEKISQAAHNQMPLWIANGTKFFIGGVNHESAEADHPREFGALLEFLRVASPTKPVRFLSGDTHYSEVITKAVARFANPFFEITSSSIHSVRPPLSRMPENPNRLVSVYDDNFIIVSTNSLDESANITSYLSKNDRKAFEYLAR